MKKLFLCAAAAAMAFAACSKQTDNNPEPKNTGVAYLSINVAASQSGRTRASGEDEGKDEDAINKLYVIALDAAGNVLQVPGSTDFYTAVTPSNQTEALKPKPHKIAATAMNLVVVANPGKELEKAIRALGESSTFATLNNAIKDVKLDEIVGTNGFAMITAGDETKAVGDKILYPYVAVKDKIKVVAGNVTENDAINAAAIDRLEVRLERLAAKLVVMQENSIKAPENAAVRLTAWTVDDVNTTYFPYAEKTLLSSTHNQSASYTNNFYTKDPNYFSEIILGYAQGLERVTVGADNAPITVWNYGWKNPGDATDAARIAYVTENTMDKDNQKFGSATRIIMRAIYTPDGYGTGKDWFMWAGTSYASLQELKDAYNHPEATTDLRDACDRFAATLKKVSSSITTFKDLNEVQLAAINHGGQAAKEDRDPVIRWFQNGVCYYSYEIRHDHEATSSSAFAKYGVVRNNWYDLTLKSVKGPGTPWYPEAINPGPGENNPEEDIDTRESYIGIDVKTNKWVIWKTYMEDVD